MLDKITHNRVKDYCVFPFGLIIGYFPIIGSKITVQEYGSEGDYLPCPLKSFRPWEALLFFPLPCLVFLLFRLSWCCCPL